MISLEQVRWHHPDDYAYAYPYSESSRTTDYDDKYHNDRYNYKLAVTDTENNSKDNKDNKEKKKKKNTLVKNRVVWVLTMRGSPVRKRGKGEKGNRSSHIGTRKAEEERGFELHHENRFGPEMVKAFNNALDEVCQACFNSKSRSMTGAKTGASTEPETTTENPTQHQHQHQHQSQTQGHCLVITGADKFFSNGHDIEWLSNTFSSGSGLELARGEKGQGKGNGKAQCMEFLHSFYRLIARIMTFPMYTIAAVQGHAFAGGCLLALACDYRVMAPGKGFISMNEIDMALLKLTSTSVPTTDVNSARSAKKEKEEEEILPGTFQGMDHNMVAILQARLTPNVVRDMLLKGLRLDGPSALALGVIDRTVSAQTAASVAMAQNVTSSGNDGLLRSGSGSGSGSSSNSNSTSTTGPAAANMYLNSKPVLEGAIIWGIELAEKSIPLNAPTMQILKRELCRPCLSVLLHPKATNVHNQSFEEAVADLHIHVLSDKDGDGDGDSDSSNNELRTRL